MNCHDVQKFAYSYLDCEFDAREKGEFEAHLAACLPCRSAVGRDAAFRLTIRDRLQQPTPCPGLEARVRGRLDRHARNTFTRKVVLPFALAAGIAGSVVVWQADVPSHGDLGDRPEASVAQARRVQPVAMAGLAVSRRPAQVAAARPQPAAPRTQELLELRKDSGLQLTAAGFADSLPAEVLRGGIDPHALATRSPFGAVRSHDSLRAMVRLHVTRVPPEVAAPAGRVQRYLQARMAGLGTLPISEGEGVSLVGARIAVVGPQPAALYQYVAWGVPVTVFSHPRAHRDLDDPEIEQPAPDQASARGMLLDRANGLHLLHVVDHDRVLTLVSELGAPALLQIAPSASWL